MSEVKTNEPVKQEGDFKIKSKKPKQLGSQKNNTTKVVINPKEPLIEIESNVTKVEIKKEEDAIQIGETKEVVVGEQAGDSAKVDEQISEPEQASKEFNPLSEVTEEETPTKQEFIEAVVEAKETINKLPENIEKLVSFMEETGGSIEDYTRLNADYSNVDQNTLLREYYKQAKPHLNEEEIGFIMEDNFDFDEDLDEERDVRKKKLAKKEEVAKAKEFLNDLKDKYYEEIKLRPGTTQEQQKAVDFFNRYNEEQNTAQQQHETFKSNTKDYFNNEFKGFEFSVGEKKFRYGVKNVNDVVDSQSNINNTIGKFLDKKGNVADVKGYHKAMYAADHADTIAQHFYEQGKSDAIRDIAAKSNNVDTNPRSRAPEDVFVGGFKVKAVSGIDSSKLTIKKRKFN